MSYLASQPWPFPASLMIGARTEATSTQITVDPEELEQALWVTREEMVTVFAGQHPVIRPSRERRDCELHSARLACGSA